MSYSDYGASISDHDSTESRPDKSLVVECKYDQVIRKIRFSSTRTCSFELLRQRVEQGFALFATPFAITYTDDDGEVTDICTDSDLTEAIRYFSPVNEERPVSSGSSILSGRSLVRGKITLRVRITVEYDGPSLSDTSSLVSLDEYKNRNSSEISLHFSASAQGPVDDDSITVSSKDMGSKYDVYRAPGGAKTVIMAQSREPLISKSPQPSIHASQRENGSSSSLHRSPTFELIQIPSDPQARLSQEMDPFVDGCSEQASSSVFERLKLEDEHQPGSSHGSSTMHSERGAAWLRDQNERTIKSMLGDLPTPSEESFDAHAQDLADRRSVLSGELALHQDPSGKYYYAYTVGSSYTPSHDSGYDDVSDVNRSSIQVEPAMSRPTSMEVYGVIVPEAGPSGSDLRRSLSAASASSNPFADPRTSAEIVFPPDYIHPDVPPEVLQFLTARPIDPPSNPPTCSNCTVILDTIRYVCSTCGEKRPLSPYTTSDSSGKGKDRALDFDSHSASGSQAYSSSPRSNTYPPSPRADSSSRSDSSWSVISGSESSHISLRSFSDSTIDTNGSHTPKYHRRKPLPAIPTSPTANSSSTLVPRITPLTNGVGTSGGNGDGMAGYELCWECLPTAGVTHALEMSVAPGSSPSIGKWNVSPEDAMSQWRRAAPSQKGQLRHAYVEKSWGYGGWQDVEQDDHNSCTCSTCGTAIVNSRFKCASCKNFNLCKACYSQVHEIHPSHAFLIVPDKIGRLRGGSGSTVQILQPTIVDGEYSLKHPGVKCMYCMQDIVGARFHCAICDSVDICQNCEAAGLPGNLESENGGHNSSHIMIKIPYPLPSAELQSASERAKSLWSGRDAATGQIVRSRRNSLVSSYDRTVMGVGSRNGGLSPGDSPTSVSGPDDHGMRCGSCNERIVGVRYQCASCPSLPKAYSLCTNCEERSYVVHDPMHVFFKLPRPLDRQLQIEYPLVPRLYKYPAGPLDGRFDPEHPKEYLKHLVHTTALCDRCMTQPTGIWFRCAYCARDLCEVCQELDTHDDSHVFVALKSLVDISLLKRFSNLNNPQPIIPFPIYSIL